MDNMYKVRRRERFEKIGEIIQEIRNSEAFLLIDERVKNIYYDERDFEIYFKGERTRPYIWGFCDSSCVCKIHFWLQEKIKNKPIEKKESWLNKELLFSGHIDEFQNWGSRINLKKERDSTEDYYDEWVRNSLIF